MPSVRIGASYAGKVSAAGAYTFFRLVTEGIPGLVTCSVRLSSLGTACANSTLSYCGSDKAPPLGVYVQRGGVTLDPSAEGPEYPPALLKAGVQGVVYARFVVDSVGHVDTASLVVLDKPNPEFVDAVRTALTKMKYRPAILHGRAVSQLVEQPFVFRIQNPDGHS